MDTLSNCQLTSQPPSSGFFERVRREMESLKSFQILLVLFFLLTSGVFAQTTVQVSEPTGGFSIDGDLRANFPAPSGVGDWFPGLTGSGGHVFTANGNVAVPVNISTTFYFKDEIRAITTPGTGNIFSSSKFDQNPNDWSWTTGNVQPKNDLGNVYLHIGTDEVTKDQWIFVGADRLATNGNAYVDFEFLQNEITPVAGGTFSADGPDGGRTVGDFLIAVEFASTPNVDFYTWEPDGNGGFAWKLNTPGPLAIAARSINGTIDPLNTYGAPYKAEQFVEAAVDFTALLNVVGDACAGVSIGNIFIKSRASGSSDQSSLADFVESIPVQIELGTATISYNSDDFCGDSALPTISGIQEGEFFISEQGVGNTGTITIDPATGEIDLTSAGPGDTYKIGYQYFSVGGNQCEKFAYFDIVLPLQVPSPAPASFDFCVGSGANQLQAISVAPFSSDYQINWFDSNMDPLQGAPSISTASAGVYTYYVSQSKIDGTECESEMAEITVNVGVCSLTLVKEATNGPTGEDCLDPTLNPTIDYSFTLTNNGAYPLTNIQISDPLFEAPNPVVALTLSDDGNGDAELGVGETWIYTASYTITATDIENGQVENQATASGDANGFTVSDLSGTAVDNDTPTVVSVCQNYELTLDKQVKSGDPYSAVGNVVVYDYVITNSGNVTLDGPFSVSDDKIAGIADVNGPLAPGASVTATGSYTISQTDIDAGFVTNIATASGNGVVSNSDTETVNATQTPSIEIVKSATPSTYNAAGDVITYTFDVSNTGNVTLTDVTVSDPLSGLSAITPGPVTLAPGENQVFTATYTITQSDMDAGQVDNTATATGNDPDDVEVSDTDSETITVVKDASIEIVKSATPSTYNAAGDVITYTFDVSNTGNVTLTDVTVSDPLSGLSAITPGPVTLAPGENQVFTATYTITQSDMDAGQVDNTATATGNDPDDVEVSDTDSETITVVKDASIEIVKSATPSTYNAAGDVITYTFDVSNTGNVTLTDVTVSDPLSGLSAITPGPVTLAPGENQVFTATYTITQSDMDAGQVDNTATATGNDPDDVEVSDTDSETITVVKDASIEIVKSATPSTYNAAGDVITYTFDVSNTGNVTLTDVTVSDPLSGLSAITPGPVTLAPGENQVFTATYTITQSDMDAGQVDNTATATGNDPDDVEVSDTDSETITVVKDASIEIVKSATPSTYNAAGDAITYTFDVSNTGNVTLTDVTVSDPLSGLSAITPGPVTLAPGENQVFTATYTITQSDMDAGQVDNTATATGNDPDDVEVSDTDSETITVVKDASIEIVKSATPSTYNAAGDVITYTFDVSNTGNVTLTDVTVSDPLSGLSAITPGPVTLAPGENQVFTATYTITQSDMDAGQVDNTATATGNDPDDVEVSDTDSETITVVKDASIEIVKSATPSTYNAAGDVITYTFDVSNTGNVTLTDVTVSDPLSGLSAITPGPVTLAPGENQVFTATYTITQSDMDAGQVDNTATATGNDPDDVEVSDTDSETITVVKDASIEIVKSATPSTYNAAGDVITYTFDVSNTGNVTLTDVTVSDPLSGLSAITPGPVTLAPGENQVFTATYTITQSDMDAGQVDNTATATGNDPDDVEVSDTDSETITVVKDASIEIVKSATPSTYNAAGDVITYTFDVSNTGNVTLTDVTVSDPLSGLSAITPGPVTLAPGENQVFTATYTITQSDMDAGQVDNTATATGNDPDDVEVSDTDSETITVVKDASIEIVKSATPSTYNAAGDVITYTFDVSNTGNVTLTDVTVSDPLSGLSAITPGPVTLAPGENQVFTATYTITQSDMDAGQVDNTATATGNDPDDVEVSDTDSETITVVKDASIEIVKSATPSTYNAAGDVITYTFDVSNTGNVTLTDVTVSDPLSGLSAITPGPVTLAPGENQVFTATYTITQSDMDAGQVDNTATATGNDPDDVEVSDTDSETITVVKDASIEIVKSATPSTYNAAGDVITYTFDVSNTGNVTLTDVTVSDPLSGLSAITPGPVTLAPGENQVFTATYTITQSDMDAGQVDNTATATGNDPDDVEVSDTDSETITVVKDASIEIVKSATPSTYNAAGDVITYTFDVSNTGNVTLTDVTVSDPLSGLSAITPGPVTLAPGENQVFTATYTITQSDMDAGQVDNTATATGNDPDDVEVSDTDSETITVVKDASIEIVKSATPSTYNAAGDVITYTFDVSNTGNVTLTDVTVSDPLSGLSAITPGPVTLAPGENQVFTATYTITQSDMDAGQVDNTATATGNDPDDVEVSDTDSETITVVKDASIEIVKSATPSTYNAAGDVITYTFDVSNTGNVTLTDVTVSDPLSGLSAITPGPVTLAPGENQVFTATYTITQSDMDAGQVDNTATATGNDPDDVEVSDTDSETITVVKDASIEIVKSATPSTYNAAGDVITYTFDVSNTGNVTLTDVTVSDPLSGLSAITPGPVTLAPGENQVFTATYTITQSDMDAGQVDNTATATGNDPDDVEVSDTDSETITVVKDASIEIVKSATPSTYNAAGDVITYTFDVSNTGNVTLTDVTVSDPLSGLSAITPGPVTLAPGENQVFTATYTITQSDMDAGQVDNTATATGNDPDDVEVSDTDSETITVVKDASIEIVKSATPSTYNAAGDVITYTFDVSNTGNVTLTDVTVSDPLSGLSAITPGPVTLAPGENQVFTATYTITQSDMDAGQVDNTATATGNDPDDVEVSDTDSETITVVKDASIEIVKSATPSTYNAAGDVITYTFDVSNTGNVTLTDVTVSDPLSGLSAITPGPVTLAPGENQVFTATYTITQSDMDAGQVDNTATATGNDPDDVEVSDTDSETITVVKDASIEIVKSATPSTYNAAGDVITYTFDVSNTGNVTLTDVTVSDPLSGLSAITPGPVTLAPGENQVFTATYTITQSDMDAGQVDNTATATGNDPDDVEVSDTDSETITVVKDASIEIVKSATPSTYNAAGDVITYTFDVSNTGNVTLTDVTVSDPLSGLSAITPGPVTLAPGENQVFTATYTITQSDMDAGQVDNTATATGNDPDDVEVSDTDSETITVVKDASIEIVKSATPSTYNAAGDVITYTFDVSNTGNVTLTDVTVSDPLSGLSAITPGPVTLAPGENQVFTATYTITQSDMDAGQVDNTATATGNDPDDVEVSDNDSETITAITDARIAIIKTATVDSEDDCYDTGDEVTYTFTVYNTGNVTLENVNVSEFHFTGSGTMSAITFVSSSMNSPEGTLMPGENAEYTATYVITQVDTDTRFINNQAEATASYGDGLTVDDLSGDTIDSDNETQVDLCQDPSLDLTKTLISNDDELGGELSFEIKVENTGNVTLYDIYVEDETTGDNWTIAELIPGAEQTFTVNVTITQEIIDGECYENTAFAEAREYLDEQEQPGSGNSDLQYIVIARDNDSAIECFTQTPSIAIVKLAGVESEDDCYDTGDLITYTFTVYNTGNVTLNNVEVNEFHFTGTGTMSAITFVSSSMNSAEGTLLPNESAIYTATYEVTLEDTNIRYINNQAEATAVFEETTVDDLSGDSIDTDNETQVDLCQNPALSIEKSIIAGNPYSVVGDVVEYQYIVTNTGNVTLDGPFTVVDDKVPGIPAAVENTLAPNESLTLTATYTISQADLTNGSVTNIASAIGYLNETEVMSNPDQATAEAIFNDILAVDDNAGTYTISGGVASINAFDNDSYLGGAANTGNVILTTVVPDPSGVLTVDENGVITIAANAVAGDYELTYRITEIGNADNYDEAVISATVEPVLLIDEIESYCELDAPYLRWLLEPANFNLQDLAPGNPNPLTMIWYDSNDQEIIRYENIPMEGYMLFPGADTLPGGYGSQWPGWKLVKKQWISGDFNFAGVREEGAYVRFELNPEVTSEIAYPGATEACNPNPNPPIAVDDDMTGIPVSSQLGYSNIVNVLDNDILGDLTGLDTDLVDVFEVSQSTPGALILDTTTGLVSVSTGLTPGIYTLEYRICTNPNPTNCDTAIVTVLVVQPSVQIEKTVVSNDDQVGGFITYNIKVINDGDVELNDIEVVDELTGDAWTVPTLAPGSSANYITQLVITQDIIEQECVTNTASATVYLSSEVESIVLAEDSDSVVECMTLSPGIDIEKVANPSQVEAAGQEIIYSLTVTNTGNVILYDVIISDPLTSLNLNVGTIAPGLSSTINSPYTVTQSDMDAGSILNVATTSGTTVKGEVVEDQDEVTVEAVRIPNIDLNKTVDLESVSREGIVLNYTLEVTNTGNVTLSSGNLVDPKTGLSLPNISLAPGEMKSFSTTYTVTLQDLLSGKPILNIATVNAVDTFSGTTVQAQGQATVSVNLEPGIEIVKTADIEEATFPGQEITYTLTVTNTGTAPLVNVLVSDPLTGFEETIGLLLPNETEVFTTTYMVTLDDLRNKEQVSNTATVKGTAPNGTEVEDMDSVDVAMNLPAPPPPPPAPDPEIIANDDDFGTYFLSYGGRLGNILENDLLNGQRPDPADVDFEFTELDGVIGLLIDDDGELSLIPGVNEAREYRLKYILREAGNPSNNDDATVVFRLQNDQVDLNVSKTSFEAEIFEGDVFDYEIVVTNGDTPASNVIVTDNLPTGVTYLSNEVTVNSSGATVTDNVSGTAITWTIPVLAADASVTIRVTVKAGAAGTITNTVIVGSDEDDTDESNNQDDDVNTILPFHIPNVITPNNDGDNDTFVIQGLGKFVSNEITIFNRYGDHVLEQENYQNDWDAPGQVAGTYFFVLTTVDSNDKTHEFKGWIQVIKEN